MNLLDRLNNRLSKVTNSHVSTSRSNLLPRESLAIKPHTQFERMADNWSSSSPQITNYDNTFPEEWTTPVTHPVRGVQESGSLVTEANPGLQLATCILTRNKQNSVSSGDLRKRSTNQGSSFYNVSSDEEHSDDDTYKDVADDPEQPAAESVAAFERRSLRIRRSLDKAKAALPADFVDRIGVSPLTMESTYHELPTSGNQKLPLSALDETVLDDPGTLRTSLSDEEAEPGSTRPGDEYFDDGHKSTGQNIVSQENSQVTNSRNQDSSFSDPEDCSSSEMLTPTIQIGIQWNTEPLRPMEELMSEFQKMPVGSTYLLKAMSQRSGCKCALCGHESLLLFPALDVSLASAFWGLWNPVTKNHSRISHYEKNQQYVACTTEVQYRLFVFRQCRGWYEILNENQQPIPHLTTVEQVRRTKPSTLLVRQDLKCLAAPPSLSIPQIKDPRTASDATSEVSLPSNLLAQASSLETLQAASSEVLPAGTLMNYVAYLPRCQVKRGRKIKELGLLLVTRRPSESSKRQLIETRPVMPNNSTRAYYIGLEDSTPALFPAKFALSPIAGPENISGVHSLASILRKFRLPLSIRPVCVPESTSSSSKLNGSRTLPSNPSVSCPSLSCGLSTLSGLTFGEQNYLRLEAIFRGNLLIISPVSCPERLFLITPSMLPDHLFRLGVSNDPAYIKLLEHHRMQATNFLAVAHSKESLNYLVRHMRDVTREPRDSYTTRQTNRTKASSDEPQMTQEEIYRAYEELDEIYFYIRHGYYPSKNRHFDSPLKVDAAVKPTGESQGGQAHQPETDYSTKKPPLDNSRVAVPKAEELLAASLSTPARNPVFRPKWPDASANAPGSVWRSQPKEYGI